MNPKVFVGFTAVTIVVVIAAAFSISARIGATGAGIGTDPVFPEFADQVNDVAELVVTTNKETLTVKRGPDNKWSIVEREGYPVPTERVQKILIALTEAKFAEPKTAKKDRYARIQVEDPSEKKALSRLIQVKDAKGQMLAELVVGRPPGGRPDPVP